MKLLALLCLASFAIAQNDNTVRLNKPVLRDNIDYLEEGLRTNLRSTAYTLREWTDNSIPQDCRDIAQRESRNPADFRIFDVTYSDCGDPWIFCYHRDSEVPIESLADQFSRLPIQMRDWVKHIVTIPNPAGGHAYMLASNLVFFRPVQDMIRVFIHEAAHSLDLNGAYGEQLSPSNNWWDHYDQDPNVPDQYALTNAIEDVAESTVIAVYNEAVAGGYEGIEPGWQNIFNQYATIITVARENGQGSSIIGPSPESQTCSRRVANSPAVPKSASAKFRRQPVPDLSFRHAEGIAVPMATESLDSRVGECELTW